MRDKERADMMLRPVFATSVFERLRGLLGRHEFDRDADAVLVLCPCNDVHTFGMRVPIDIAFVDSSGKVIASCEHVHPAHRLREHEAVMVLERLTPVSSGSEMSTSCQNPAEPSIGIGLAGSTPWVKVGERICLHIEPIPEAEPRSKA